MFSGRFGGRLTKRGFWTFAKHLQNIWSKSGWQNLAGMGESVWDGPSLPNVDRADTFVACFTPGGAWGGAPVFSCGCPGAAATGRPRSRPGCSGRSSFFVKKSRFRGNNFFGYLCLIYQMFSNFFQASEQMFCKCSRPIQNQHP